MTKIVFGFIVILCLISFILSIKYWSEGKITGIIQFIISTVLTLVTIGMQIWPQKIADLVPGLSEITKENVKLVDEINMYTKKIESLNKQVEELNKQVEYLTNNSTVNENPSVNNPTDAPTLNLENNFIDITSLHPLIGNIDDFFYNADGVLDNMGEECNGYMFFCRAENYSNEITFVLDKNYTQLETTLRLRNADNDIQASIWIEFYSVNDGEEKKIGESERFKAGIKPSKTIISLENVTDLKIKTNSPTINDGGVLLTDGIFLKCSN